MVSANFFASITGFSLPSGAGGVARVRVVDENDVRQMDRNATPT
jgi:hypothetical protein